MEAVTLTSKRPNGYPLFGKYVVHMVLDGVSGRDIADTYGIPKQQEVMFLPGDRYKVNSVSVANDGHPIIFAKEIANNEVQIGEGDYEGRKLESTRNSGNDRQVSRREGDDGGRVLLRDGRGEQTDRRGGGREVHNANNLSGKASRELDIDSVRGDLFEEGDDGLGTVTIKTVGKDKKRYKDEKLFSKALESTGDGHVRGKARARSEEVDSEGK